MSMEKAMASLRAQVPDGKTFRSLPQSTGGDAQASRPGLQRRQCGCTLDQARCCCWQTQALSRSSVHELVSHSFCHGWGQLHISWTVCARFGMNMTPGKTETK